MFWHLGFPTQIPAIFFFVNNAILLVPHPYLLAFRKGGVVLSMGSLNKNRTDSSPSSQLGRQEFVFLTMNPVGGYFLRIRKLVRRLFFKY